MVAYPGESTMQIQGWLYDSLLLSSNSTKKVAYLMTQIQTHLPYGNSKQPTIYTTKGDNLSRISKAHIYDLSGKLIQTVENPFKNSNKIDLKGLVKGNYILIAESFSAKFIIE